MIKVRGKRPVVVKQVEKNTALEEKAKLANLDWRIVGATILHRYPVITPDIDPLEAQINEWEDQRTAFRRQVSSATYFFFV